MSNQICVVTIVGSTHPNELIGYHLVKKFEQFPELLQRDSFKCETVLANIKGIGTGLRYLDRDLNRCFGNEDLANLKLTSYEDIRAKQLNTLLGPKDRPKSDFIIDLHSSTANMALSILPTTKHPFNLKLAAYLTTLHPAVRVLLGVDCTQNAPRLRSLTPLGCAIEVGPIANNVLNADLFMQTEMIVHSILNYIDAENKGKSLPVPSTLTAYQSLFSIDYPRDSSNEIQAMIHPQLQGQDYEPLYKGDPIFLTFSGEKIDYESESTVYPAFVNEAAYYSQGVAMTLTQKEEIEIW
jgi:succinylglutamate desuccinylase